MADRTETGWTRRDLVGGAALLALALGVPAVAVRLSRVSDAALPTPQQAAMLREVSQLVIPRTATAGAGELAVGEFVALALAHGLEDSRRPLPPDAAPRLLAHRLADGALNHVGWLEAELDRRAGGGFMSLPAEARAATLAALDAEAYAPDVRDHPWRRIKALVLTGYYTTQVGGAQELRYELVPGRWDPDLPATPATVAWSSDWTAVDFG